MANELKSFGYAPGSYMNNCKSCSQTFMSDKRAWNCEPCAKALSLQAGTRPAAPVEGLETIGYVPTEYGRQLDFTGLGISRLYKHKGSSGQEAVVARSQAEAIIADLHAAIAVNTVHPLIVQRAERAEADNAALTERVKELDRYLETASHNAQKYAKDCEALETQLAAVEKIAFEHGYVLACCNIVNLHDEPTIAHDALSELGVTRQAVKAMNLSEFDLKALRKIERGCAGSPYAKANRKARTALEAKP